VGRDYLARADVRDDRLPLDSYAPFPYQSTDIGPYEIRFEADGTATFTYSVADRLWDAGAPAPRTGTLRLQRQAF
jgi:hypothetical protein